MKTKLGKFLTAIVAVALILVLLPTLNAAASEAQDPPPNYPIVSPIDPNGVLVIDWNNCDIPNILSTANYPPAPPDWWKEQIKSIDFSQVKKLKIIGNGTITNPHFNSMDSNDDNPLWQDTYKIELDLSDFDGYIGNHAFESCQALFGHLDVPITPDLTLGEGAFRNTSFTSVFIPKEYVVIGERVFTESPLAHITFETGSELKIIGDNAFSSTKLVELNLPEKLEVIGQFAFISRFNNVGTKPITEFATFSSLIIPRNVTSIGNGAFGFLPNLLAVRFDNDISLMNIEGYNEGNQGGHERFPAFIGCVNLQLLAFTNPVDLPDGATQASIRANLYGLALENGSLDFEAMFAEYPEDFDYPDVFTIDRELVRPMFFPIGGTGYADPNDPTKPNDAYFAGLGLFSMIVPATPEDMVKMVADVESITDYLPGGETFEDIAGGGGSSSVGGSVSVVVDNGTQTSIKVNITIEKGSTPLDELTAGETGYISGSASKDLDIAKGESATVKFSGLPDGFYNIVANLYGSDGKIDKATTITRGVQIKDGKLVGTVADIVFIGKLSTVVDVTQGAPKASVGGIESLITASDTNTVNAGGIVKILVTVSPAEESGTSAKALEDRAAIRQIKSGAPRAEYFFDVDVDKYITPYGSISTQHTHLTELPELLTIAFEVPSSLRSTGVIAVYRNHDYGLQTRVDKLTTSPNANGEYFEQVGNWLIVHARNFSTYALETSIPASSGSNGSTSTIGGSSSSSTTTSATTAPTATAAPEPTPIPSEPEADNAPTDDIPSIAQSEASGDDADSNSAAYTIPKSTPPKTGDSGVALWAALAVIGAAATVLTTKKRKA
ncbi:MAG: leucine-rich repeat domain-containing protein [Oscillospiraceae bacterium]|jgi:hypothetical protein|nr:leucine-rich repeat domain-containing protein [Oscillospiraceae bacterium]